MSCCTVLKTLRSAEGLKMNCGDAILHGGDRERGMSAVVERELAPAGPVQRLGRSAPQNLVSAAHSSGSKLPRHNCIHAFLTIFMPLHLSPPCKTASPQFIFSPSALRNVSVTVQQDTDLQ